MVDTTFHYNSHQVRMSIKGFRISDYNKNNCGSQCYGLVGAIMSAWRKDRSVCMVALPPRKELRRSLDVSLPPAFVTSTDIYTYTHIYIYMSTYVIYIYICIHTYSERMNVYTCIQCAIHTHTNVRLCINEAHGKEYGIRMHRQPELAA